MTALKAPAMATVVNPVERARDEINRAVSEVSFWRKRSLQWRRSSELGEHPFDKAWDAAMGDKCERLADAFQSTAEAFTALLTDAQIAAEGDSDAG